MLPISASVGKPNGKCHEPLSSSETHFLLSVVYPWGQNLRSLSDALENKMNMRTSSYLIATMGAF
jgi:transcriptional regulator with PAS, ATPase and Fis domain